MLETPPLASTRCAGRWRHCWTAGHAMTACRSGAALSVNSRFTHNVSAMSRFLARVHIESLSLATYLRHMRFCSCGRDVGAYVQLRRNIDSAWSIRVHNINTSCNAVGDQQSQYHVETCGYLCVMRCPNSCPAVVRRFYFLQIKR